MLSILLFALGGFLVGAALTGLVSVYVIGLIHADAARICESYGAVALFSTSGSGSAVAMERAP